MPGAVVRIAIELGDNVKAGDEILVLEAMKMESPVKAPKDCKIISIEVSVGDNVKNGDTLVMIEKGPILLTCNIVYLRLFKINSKSEARNPKQIPNVQTLNAKNRKG